MKAHTTLSVATAISALSACAPSGGIGLSSYSAWNYQCDTGQSMEWRFFSGRQGEYRFQSGSVLNPVSGDLTKTLFTRQDGVVYRVSGDGDAWTFARVDNGKATNCTRKLVVA